MNANEIECTRCGETVYYELNECPACGLNFYLPEEDEGQETWTAEQSDIGGISIWRVSVAGVFFGWLSASLIFFVFQLLGISIVPFAQPNVVPLLILTTGAIAGFAGGYLAGWLSNERHLFAASLVGVLTLFSSIIVEAYWRDLVSEALLNLWTVLTWAAILLAAFSGGFVSRKRSLRVDDILFGDEEALYHELMLKIGYDPSLAERLIALERQRTPMGTRATLIWSAITRWERDNRL